MRKVFVKCTHIALTAFLLGSYMRIMVPLDTIKELLSTLRVPDVLNTDIHPFLNVAIADDLVDNDTNGRGGDVVDDTGPADSRIASSAFH